MVTFSCTDSTSTTLTIRVRSLPSGTAFVRWYIGKTTSSMPYDGYTEPSSTTSTYPFEGLDPDTTYYIKIKCLDSSQSNSLGVYPDDDGYVVTYSTEAESSTWEIGNTYTWTNMSEEQKEYLSFGISGYVARFKISFARSGAATFRSTGNYDTYAYLSTTSTFDEEEGGPKTYLTSNDDSGSGNNFKISWAVTAGTVYYLWVRLYSIDDTGSCNVYVTPPPLEIDEWDWSISNGSATAAQTQKAYTAITSRGAVSDFSYLVWNDLVNKVNDVKAEVGVSWNTKYLSLSNTLMTSSSKTLTADRFNSLRYNIGIHESTELYDVYTGDEVYGWYFTTLTDALNTWIADLTG